MKQYTTTTVRMIGPSFPLRDNEGTGNTPIQVQVVGSATFRVLGRAHPNAPWVELRAPGSTSFLESVQYVPYLALDVTAVSGTVNFYIGSQ